MIARTGGKRHPIFVIGSVVLAFAFAIGYFCVRSTSVSSGDGSQSPDSALAGSRTKVMGVVVDPDGAAVRSAWVGLELTAPVAQLLEQYPELDLTVRAGQDGEFNLFLPRQLGVITLVARKAPFLPGRSAAIMLQDDAADPVLLELMPAQRVKGRVSDADGVPIVGAEVKATLTGPRSDTTPRGAKTLTATSRDKGLFSLSGVASGNYEIIAEHEGFLRRTLTEEPLPPRGALGMLEVLLVPEVFVQGQVVDSKMQPVKGATVEVATGPERRTQWQTDLSGQFRLGPLEARGPIALLVSAEGFGESRVGRVVAPTKDLIVTLYRNGSLKGLVLADSTRAPIGKFEIEAHRDSSVCEGRIDASDSSEHLEFIDDNGRFEIQNLAPGTWCVAARADGYQLGVARGIRILEGQTTADVVLALEQGRSLRGVVVAEETGMPIPSATVRASVNQAFLRRSELPSSSGRSVLTDRDGFFELDGLPADEVTIEASAVGYLRSQQTVDPTIDEGTMLNMALARGALVRGVVRLADGSALADVRVTLSRYDSTDGDTAFSDERGQFHIPSTQAGHYLISAKSPLGVAAERPIIVPGDGQDAWVELILEPREGVQGRIYGLLQGEKDRTTVEVLMGQVHVTRTYANEDGRYVLQGLSPGPADIVVQTPLGRRATKSVNLSGFGPATVDFYLSAGARLFGRITQSGKPIDAVRLEALPLDGQPCAGTTRSVGGRYEFVGLDSGNYLVSMEMGSSVTTYVDGDTRLNIELSDLTISGIVRDLEEGTAIAGAVVYVRDSTSLLGEETTDYRGAFEFVGLDPGQYRLSAYKSGYSISFQEAIPGNPATQTNIDLSSDEGQRIRVTNAATGLPLDWILVKAVSNLSDDFIFLEIELDKQGVARLPSSLSSDDLAIFAPGYRHEVVSRWNGLPIDVAMATH